MSVCRNKRPSVGIHTVDAATAQTLTFRPKFAAITPNTNTQTPGVLSIQHNVDELFLLQSELYSHDASTSCYRGGQLIQHTLVSCNGCNQMIPATFVSFFPCGHTICHACNCIKLQDMKEPLSCSVSGCLYCLGDIDVLRFAPPDLYDQYGQLYRSPGVCAAHAGNMFLRAYDETTRSCDSCRCEVHAPCSCSEVQKWMQTIRSLPGGDMWLSGDISNIYRQRDQLEKEWQDLVPMVYFDYFISFARHSEKRKEEVLMRPEILTKSSMTPDKDPSFIAEAFQSLIDVRHRIPSSSSLVPACMNYAWNIGSYHVEQERMLFLYLLADLEQTTESIQNILSNNDAVSMNQEELSRLVLTANTQKQRLEEV